MVSPASSVLPTTRRRTGRESRSGSAIRLVRSSYPASAPTTRYCADPVDGRGCRRGYGPRRACLLDVVSTSTCSGVSASASVSLFRCAFILLTSSAPSHRDTTTVATPLPTRLVSARASDMKRSTPRMSAIDGDRNRADGRKRRGQHDEAAAGHAGSALRGQQQDAEQCRAAAPD